MQVMYQRRKTKPLPTFYDLQNEERARLSLYGRPETYGSDAATAKANAVRYGAIGAAIAASEGRPNPNAIPPADALDIRNDNADGVSLARLAKLAGNTLEEQAEVERLARIEDAPRFYVVLPTGGLEIGQRFTADANTVWGMTLDTVAGYAGQIVECVRIWEPSDEPDTYRFEVVDGWRPLAHAVAVENTLGDYGGDADVNETPVPASRGARTPAVGQRGADLEGWGQPGVYIPPRLTPDGDGFNLLSDGPAKPQASTPRPFDAMGYPKARETADVLHKVSGLLRDATWRIDSAFRSLREAEAASNPAAIAEAQAKIEAAQASGLFLLASLGT